MRNFRPVAMEVGQHCTQCAWSKCAQLSSRRSGGARACPPATARGRMRTTFVTPQWRRESQHSTRCARSGALGTLQWQREGPHSTQCVWPKSARLSSRRSGGARDCTPPTWWNLIRHTGPVRVHECAPTPTGSLPADSWRRESLPSSHCVWPNAHNFRHAAVAAREPALHPLCTLGCTRHAAVAA